MRQRIPGFGFALSTSIALALSACGGAAASMKAEALVAPPAPPADPEMAASGAARGNVAGVPGVPSRTDSTPNPAAASLTARPHGELLDIEAHVSLQVPQVKPALRSLRELSARLGGVVTAERVDTASDAASAQLTLRVPSGAAQGVLDELDQLGKVLEQNVTARDIGKDFFDANLRLSSLEATLHRYEQVLSHATKVDEILRIEQELGRLRAEIEQVKGNLRWLSDRAARATLHLTLREHPPEVAHSHEPKAKFFPSLRVPLLLDVGKHETQSYFGGGLALRFSRAVSLNLDVLERTSSDSRGPDALLATVGGEVYSDLLGGGERRFLNPYLGWRAGYARFDSDNQLLVGATLGLELYKTPVFGVDVEARNYLAFVGDRGPHYALSPSLSARLAF